MINDVNFPGIPAAMLEVLPYTENIPHYMIFGAIGFTIAHEITHGFDNQGKEYDQHGKKVNWWTEETKKRFVEKEQCFIRQYGNYTNHLNGLKASVI